MDTAETMVTAFEAETGTAPVVNVSGVDAPTVTSTDEPAAKPQKFYTEDDLAKVRSQEKDKLYPEIERLKEELSVLKKEREEKAAKRAEEDARKAQQAKEETEAEMDVRQLLKTKEQEWQEQLERERQERERAFALLEREKQYAELQTYRQQLVEQERDNIIPQLVDFIQGNTPEELNQSVERLKERSASILESAQAAMQNARKEMTGTRATLPASGPLDTNMESRQFTAQDIAAMSVNDYAKYRDKLMSESARGKSRGLFG